MIERESHELLDWAGFCYALRLSPSTAERLVRDPKSDIPRPFRIGRQRFVLRADVTAYIDAKRAEQLSQSSSK